MSQQSELTTPTPFYQHPIELQERQWARPHCRQSQDEINSPKQTSQATPGPTMDDNNWSVQLHQI